MKKISLLFVIVVLLGGYFWMRHAYSTATEYRLEPGSEERVPIVIPDGATGKEIATLLKEEDLIMYEMAFTHYLKENELSGTLKSGSYVFQKGYSMTEIVDILVEGAVGEVSITILEGWTAEQVAQELESNGLTTVEAFMDCVARCEFDYDFLPEGGYLEGYLYPDTYFVDYDFYTDQRFIGRMLGNLETRLSPEDWEAVNDSERSFEDIMIIASIVEREAGSGGQIPIVAGIMWNRVDLGMRLDADATVLYALGRTSGGITGTDLEVDSPYNTRKNVGLPPTPIANPAIDTIRGALYPTDTNYLYYLHDLEGGIHYAETNDQHNQNKFDHL